MKNAYWIVKLDILVTIIIINAKLANKDASHVNLIRVIVINVPNMYLFIITYH